MNPVFTFNSVKPPKLLNSLCCLVYFHGLLTSIFKSLKFGFNSSGFCLGFGYLVKREKKRERRGIVLSVTTWPSVSEGPSEGMSRGLSDKIKEGYFNFGQKLIGILKKLARKQHYPLCYFWPYLTGLDMLLRMLYLQIIVSLTTSLKQRHQ